MKFLDLFENNTPVAEADIPTNFEVNPAQRTLADIGRKLMDKAASTKDDALSTALSRVGNELTSYGTSFGASNIQELEKKSGVSRASIMKMMDYGKRMLEKEGAASIADEAVTESEKDTHCSDKCCGADVKREDCGCPANCPHCNCNDPAINETLSPEEKRLVNQMYNKDGTLTDLGKRVMNHGKTVDKSLK